VVVDGPRRKAERRGRVTKPFPLAHTVRRDRAFTVPANHGGEG
jgi:hypothetical protein